MTSFLSRLSRPLLARALRYVRTLCFPPVSFVDRLPVNVHPVSVMRDALPAIIDSQAARTRPGALSHATAGFTLLEVVLALSLVGGISAYTISVSSQLVEDSRAAVSAEKLVDIKSATERYIVANFDQIATDIGISGAPIEIDIDSDLKANGFLLPTFQAINGFGHQYHVSVGETPTGELIAMVVAYGGREAPRDVASKNAILAGSSGGLIDPDVAAADQVLGAFGGYTVDLSGAGTLNFTAAPNFPTDSERSGRNAAVVFFNPQQLANDFLHRYAIPGVPEANRMHTAIDSWSDGTAATSVFSITREDLAANASNGRVWTLSADGSFIQQDPADANNVGYRVDADGTIRAPAVGLPGDLTADRYRIEADGSFFGLDMTIRDQAIICQDSTSGNRCGIVIAGQDGGGADRSVSIDNQAGALQIRGFDSAELQTRSGTTVIQIDDTTVQINPNTNLGGTLDVTGATTLRATLNAQGNADFDQNVNIDGTLSVGGNIAGNGDLAIGGASALAGPVTAGDTLTALGPTQLNNTLDVAGDAVFDRNMTVVGDITTGGLFYSSDRRLKTDITQIQNALQKVLAIQGVEYRWRKDGRSHIGVIAQDVRLPFPELVKPVRDPETGLDILRVEYSQLIAPVIEAIRELSDQNHDLRSELAILRAAQAELDALGSSKPSRAVSDRGGDAGARPGLTSGTVSEPALRSALPAALR